MNHFDILLTGVTGALGSSLLPYLLREFPDSHIHCLIRDQNQRDARERLEEVLVDAVSHVEIERIKLVLGDISSKNFGMAEEYELLANKVGMIFHLAASVDFNGSLADSRRINLDGTANIVSFARHCVHLNDPDFRLCYVSTSYVVGNRRGLLLESDLNTGQAFWNSYEQSKCEAEELIAREMSNIPITIFRPSQIIGNSRTGQIKKFFGFYEFVALAARGRSKVLVADPNTKPDMVPSDYICQAMLYLARKRDAVGRTYHLASGLKRSATVSDVVDIVLEVLRSSEVTASSHIRRPKVVPADLLESNLSKVELDRYQSSAQHLLMRTYQPYLAYERDFDVGATHQTLENVGIVIPDISAAIRVTVEYALRSRENPRKISRVN